ncbi:MAG: AbrB family transcriptional regulator [Burkholderiaceae bacterium]|nr:AbrB family transcriptional regulator [Burkholderiaceae bacterium]
MRLASFTRVTLTLLLALAAAGLCVALHTPLPWMIGPLLATAAVSLTGAPTESWTPLRNSGQWVIGAALGLYFTSEMTSLVINLWWAVLAGIAWALLLGVGFGTWLHRLHAPRMPDVGSAQMRATCYFAGAIGAASEMTLMAERIGARTDLVAAAHSLRLMLVVVLIPFGLQAWGLTGIDLTPAGPKAVDAAGLALLAFATGAGALLMRWAGRANPWFMGALLVSMGLTMAGITLSAIPPWLSNAAQLVIGVSLGVRFTSQFIHTAPRWLASVALGTLVMMGLCALFAWALSLATGLHPVTLLLGTSPGGITEMSITAKVLRLGVPVVTAFQVCRLVAVLLLANPLWHFLEARRQRGAPV